MNQLATLRMLWTVSLRNLYSHKVKSLIVGSIMFFGTFLVVLGTSLLDSVEDSMSKSIISSIAGHIQVYDKDAKDDLALFGGGMMGRDDNGRIDDFSAVKKALDGFDNVKAVVPMGSDMGLVSSVGELDRALTALRDAVREEKKEPIPALKVQVREIAKQMIEEQHAIEVITKDKEAIKKNLAILERVDADAIWVEFDQKPLEVLEYLDTKLAPLAEEGRMLFFQYIGTDLKLFRQHFDRFEIVRGEMVPEGKRGFLCNEKFYQDWVKNYAARTLDKVYRGVTEQGKKIEQDPLLQALVRQLAEQHKAITYQLDPEESKQLAAKLTTYLRDGRGDSDDLVALIQAFFALDDQNIAERHKYFYDEIAPLIDLYDIDVGEILTLRTFTRSGILKAINIELYGTFRFKGLERSELAGGHNLMDMLSYRELYGLMTKEKLQELATIRDEVGLADVAADGAEDALFGGDEEVEIAEEGDIGFDEFEGVTLSDERERMKAMQEATFTQEELDNGLALNVAVVLKDGTRLRESMAAIGEKLEAEKLNLQVVDWQTASGMVGQLIWFIRLILYVAIFIIFVVALVIINNSMVMATMERVTEIGTLRAIGAQRRFILTMFLVETIALGLIAGVLGVLCGAGVVELAASTGIPAGSDAAVFFFGGPRLYPFIGADNLVVGVIIILVVSIISTLYPAWIATRIQPVTAMGVRET